MMMESHAKYRVFAMVHASKLHPRTLHMAGLPPELAGGVETRKSLPAPDVLLIEQESERSVFLYRLTRTGAPGGDTWHESVEDAKYQAEFELGDVIGDWQQIPTEVADARAFVVRAVGETSGPP
jgi:hypothetical protein